MIKSIFFLLRLSTILCVEFVYVHISRPNEQERHVHFFLVHELFFLNVFYVHDVAVGLCLWIMSSSSKKICLYHSFLKTILPKYNSTYVYMSNILFEKYSPERWTLPRFSFLFFACKRKNALFSSHKTIF